MQIPIETHERKRIDEIIRFIKSHYAEMTPEGKKVFILMLSRDMGTEIQRVLREVKDEKLAQESGKAKKEKLQG